MGVAMPIRWPSPMLVCRRTRRGADRRSSLACCRSRSCWWQPVRRGRVPGRVPRSVQARQRRRPDSRRAAGLVESRRAAGRPCAGIRIAARAGAVVGLALASWRSSRAGFEPAIGRLRARRARVGRVTGSRANARPGARAAPSSFPAGRRSGAARRPSTRDGHAPASASIRAARGGRARRCGGGQPR